MPPGLRGDNESGDWLPLAVLLRGKLKNESGTMDGRLPTTVTVGSAAAAGPMVPELLRVKVYSKDEVRDESEAPAAVGTAPPPEAARLAMGGPLDTRRMQTSVM